MVPGPIRGRAMSFVVLKLSLTRLPKEIKIWGMKYHACCWSNLPDHVEDLLCNNESNEIEGSELMAPLVR